MNLTPAKLEQNEYRIRLNRTIDYIHQHYSEDLNLDKLAGIACFSKFYFHRLFHAMVGETLNDFIQRVRLEKSIQKLTRYPLKSITEIALDCGFSCSQNYSKAFRARYGVTPSVVRQKYNWDKLKLQWNHLSMKKISDLNPSEAFLYLTYLTKQKLPLDEILDKQQALHVQIVKIPDMRIAYIRSKGIYNLEKADLAFHQLIRWAEHRELINESTMFLTVLWNSTSITPGDKLIRDHCITVPQSVNTDKWMNVQTVPGGKFAVHHCEVAPGYIREAWRRFVLNLLIFSDYQLGEYPFYQFWCDYSETKSMKHRILDLYLPIKSLPE